MVLRFIRAEARSSKALNLVVQWKVHQENPPTGIKILGFIIADRQELQGIKMRPYHAADAKVVSTQFNLETRCTSYCQKYASRTINPTFEILLKSSKLESALAEVSECLMAAYREGNGSGASYTE